jgi:hypothetical protein
VLIGSEYAGESGVLAVGEQADTGAQHSADAVERITDPAAVPAGVLLDALGASVQRTAGQGDNIKWVHHRDSVGDFFGCGGLEAGEAVHGHGLDPVAERWCPGLEAGLEHLLGSAFDHVRQSRRSGAVADRGEIDDDGDELVPAAGVAPSKRGGSAISIWWPVARTASSTVCQDAQSPAAIRAIDIRSMTTLFNAHITACVESFALGAAAAVVSWCQTCPQTELR